MPIGRKTTPAEYEYPVEWEAATVVAHYITATTMGAGIEIIREFDTVRFNVTARSEGEANAYAERVLNDLVCNRPGYYIETIVCVVKP